MNFFSRTVQGVSSDGTQGYIQFEYIWLAPSVLRTVFILFGDSMMSSSSDGRDVSNIIVRIQNADDGSLIKEWDSSIVNVGSGFFTFPENVETS